MLYCPNCHRLCHEDRCDECSRVLTRGPEPEDYCLLIELGALEGGMLQGLLEENGIPVASRTVLGAALMMLAGSATEHVQLFVPFRCFEQAQDLMAAFFGV